MTAGYTDCDPITVIYTDGDLMTAVYTDDDLITAVYTDCDLLTPAYTDCDLMTAVQTTHQRQLCGRAQNYRGTPLSPAGKDSSKTTKPVACDSYSPFKRGCVIKGL